MSGGRFSKNMVNLTEVKCRSLHSFLEDESEEDEEDEKTSDM